MVFNTNITTVSTTLTLDISNDVYLVDASSGSITITLPNINADGIQYKLVRIDNNTSNTVTIQGNIPAQTIDTDVSLLLPVQKVLDIQSFGIDSGTPIWYVVNLPGVNDILDCRYYDVYSTESQSIPTAAGTPITVNFNTQRAISDPGAFTLGSGLTAGEITANITDLYKISYRISTSISSGSVRSTCRSNLEIDTGGGFVSVPGSFAFYYNRNTQPGQNTANTTVLLNLNAGDIIRVRIERNDTGGGTASLVTVANSSEIVLNNVCGLTAPATIFGSNALQASSRTQSNTTSTTYQTKVTISVPAVPSGTYRIGYTYEVGITPNAQLMDVRSIIDPSGTPILMSDSSFESDADFHTMGGFFYATSFTGGVDIEIQYRVQPGSTGTASIRNSALEFWRIS